MKVSDDRASSTIFFKFLQLLEASASCVDDTASAEDKEDEDFPTAEDTEPPAQPTQQIEVELMALCKQRDALLHQLAEARAREFQTIGSISAAQEKLNGISGFLAAHGKASSSEPPAPVDLPPVSFGDLAAVSNSSDINLGKHV
ncbi:unnamed protein product [Dibothriocephalus latus]|uniref:Uncharacterized protein n=1 Tax=Dibothriocephalus latus TaxID=60516 RepID=A0A3P7LX84_DIBLA|nr:unnamed protein product [Dibothriocephalus latus]